MFLQNETILCKDKEHAVGIVMSLSGWYGQEQVKQGLRCLPSPATLENNRTHEEGNTAQRDKRDKGMWATFGALFLILPPPSPTIASLWETC